MDLKVTGVSWVATVRAMSSGRPARVVLADGLELRAATAADVEAIEAEQLLVFGPGERQGVRTFLTGPGFAVDGWAVVCDPSRAHGEHVVAACALEPFPLVVDGLDVPAGEIEFVATHPDFRRRGLVRALVGWHHERSDERGDLVQLISGIPYVYRRFGYGWGISAPTEVALGDAELRPDPAVRFRPATADDTEALLALEVQRDGIEVRGRRDARRFARWRWLSDLADPEVPAGDRFRVAERDGHVVGWELTGHRPDEHAHYVLGAMAADDGVADAVLERARAHARAASVRQALYAHPRTVFGHRLHEVGTPDPTTYGIYVRVPDPLALLRHLQPLLSARLSASWLAGSSGEATVSLYTDAVRLSFERGEVTAIERVPPLEDPTEVNEAGVAPDWFPALVLGRFGAGELERRVDDVLLGRHRELLSILFPPLEADVYADF
jgi:predicted N-acetyltransferase YhbS